MDPFTTREIDIHGMSVIEARKYMKTTLNTLSPMIKELRIIHGHKGGIALQKFVRQEFSHKRIERKILELNQGMTTYLLK